MNTGFPSPAQYYQEPSMDLNKHLMPHPETTFFMRVKSTCYEEFHIQKDDLLLVDRSFLPNKNNIVVAIVDGHRCLLPYGKLELLGQKMHTVELWGVVTYVVHAVSTP